MAYTKTVWEDLPSENTIIDADKLNNMEDGIEDAHTVLGTTSATEIGYVKGVTSAIQTQLDNKRVGIDGSNHTTIGTNSVRATRYVAITPVVVVDNADPTIANTWVDVDISASVSANCYAVMAVGLISSPTAGRILNVRKNGTSLVIGALTNAVSNPTANQYGMSLFTVEVDTNKVFEYSVTNVDVTSVYIIIRGYWEYVD